MAMCFLYQYLFSYGTFVIQENPALRQHKDPRSLGSLPVCVWTFPEVTTIFQGFFSKKINFFRESRSPFENYLEMQEVQINSKSL